MLSITCHGFPLCAVIFQDAYVTNGKGDFEVVSNKLLLHPTCAKLNAETLNVTWCISMSQSVEIVHLKFQIADL